MAKTTKTSKGEHKAYRAPMSDKNRDIRRVPCGGGYRIIRKTIPSR